MLTRFLASQVERKAGMERDVFASPPKDWNEYQRRLGKWVEVTESISEIEAILEDADK